jgi:hypothetical protein
MLTFILLIAALILAVMLLFVGYAYLTRKPVQKSVPAASPGPRFGRAIDSDE